MLSARDWADAFGLQLYWQSAKQRLTVVGRGTYAIMTAGERLVTLPASMCGVDPTRAAKRPHVRAAGVSGLVWRNIPMGPRRS